jgi:hypothetical protein
VCYKWLCLSALVYLAPALHNSIVAWLGSVRLGLARLGTAWFIQRDGKQVFAGLKNITRSGIRFTFTRAHCSYCAHNWEIVFWTIIQSRACAERACYTNLPPGPRLLVRCQVKWLRQYLLCDWRYVSISFLHAVSSHQKQKLWQLTCINFTVFLKLIVI